MPEWEQELLLMLAWGQVGIPCSCRMSWSAVERGEARGRLQLITGRDKGETQWLLTGNTNGTAGRTGAWSPEASARRA